MRAIRSDLSLLVLLTSLFLVRVPVAQIGVEEPGEYAADLEKASYDLGRGRRERARSVYEEILEMVEEGEDDEIPLAKEQAEAWTGLARIQSQAGEYDKALESLAKAQRLHSSSPQVVLQARVLAQKGRYEEALSRVSGLGLDGVQGAEEACRLEAKWLQGDWLRFLGKNAEARRVWSRIVDLGKSKTLELPGAKLWFAKALISLGGRDQLYQGSQLLVEVSRKNPYLAEAYVSLGDLYFEVYHEAGGYKSGESEYQRALQNCGEVEGALLGLYLSRKDNYLLDYAKTQAYLRRALEQNPRSVRALRLKAATSIDNRNFEGGYDLLKRALAINPRDKVCLAEMAAACHFTYRTAEEKEYRKRVLQIDRTYTHVDMILGRHQISLYRFQDALIPLRKANAAKPGDYETLLALGRALLQTGQGKEAEKALLETRRIRPGWVNPWRENQLFLQKRINEKYDIQEKGNFSYVLHPDEEGVLGPYLQKAYEESWKVLGAKYGTYPDCKVRVECFERFGDFSVRTIGYKGFGALGACFGCLITSVSPGAPELRSQFSWRVTARHEFSHVLHLKLSKARVPRWLTEGMAVYEEIAMDPANDRRMERELHTALRNNSIFPLTKLNQAFRSSKILFGYYQGGLIVRYLAQEYDFKKLVELVKAYAEDKSTAQIFQEVLGLEAKTFDARFRRYVEGMVGDLKLVPLVEEATMSRLLLHVAKNPEDRDARLMLASGFVQRRNFVDAGTQLGALKKLDPDNGDALLIRAKMAMLRKDSKEARRLLKAGFAAGGDDFDSRMLMASLLLQAGRKQAALEELKAAVTCWPTCPTPGQGSPFLGQARILAGMGKKAEAAALMNRYIALHGQDYSVRRQLATWYREKGDAKDELVQLEAARDVDPFDRELHSRLATIYQEDGRLAEAAFVLRMALATKPDRDRVSQGPAAGSRPAGPGKEKSPEQELAFQAGLRLRLAEILLELGHKVEARAEAKRILGLGKGVPGEVRDRAQEIVGS